MKALYRWLRNTLPRPLLIRLSYVFRLFAPMLYYGNKVECNVCQKKFKKFLSYGSKVAERDNVLCPYCLTLERHRLIWMYLQDKTDFFSDRKFKVLHIAPEQCFHKKFKKQANLEYVTGDLESPIADLHFDLHAIPLEDNKFDIVFCNHVLEHVEDDFTCMKELYRVMKPGGFGIFQVPLDTSRKETYEDPSITSPDEREKHFWQKDHVRLYGLDYPDRLIKAGFSVDAVDLQQELGIEAVEKFRLQKEEKLFVCFKD